MLVPIISVTLPPFSFLYCLFVPSFLCVTDIFCTISIWGTNFVLLYDVFPTSQFLLLFPLWVCCYFWISNTNGFCSLSSFLICALKTIHFPAGTVLEAFHKFDLLFPSYLVQTFSNTCLDFIDSLAIKTPLFNTTTSKRFSSSLVVIDFYIYCGHRVTFGGILNLWNVLRLA